jgi:uncharacterized NAD(P)/FAD-binding protein YdhS
MRVALVGGGPIAAAVAEALIHAHEAERLGDPLTMVAFDPAHHEWCGPNFAPDVDEVITNTVVDDMSLRWWQRGHFSDWCMRNGYERYAGYEFPPRWVFGRYAQHTAKQANKHLVRFREQVTQVTAADDHVTISTAERVDRFDYAVLCVGSSVGGSDPYGLEGRAGYVRTPYPLASTLPTVAADARVGVIGSGLTAVDVVLSLAANGHRGPITLMSRRGWLPAVRRPRVDYVLRHFTIERLEQLAAATGRLSLRDLIELGCTELDAAGGSRAAVPRELFAQDAGLERLRRQLSIADDGDVAWPVTFKMMVTAAQDAWHLLSDADKAFLRKMIGHQASNLCCAMPRHRAEQLLELADAGQLRCVRGVRSVTAQPDGSFLATGEGPDSLRFDTVISAISGEDRTPPSAESIVDGLLRSSGARTHPLGGLDVERSTNRLVAGDGRPQPRLYALGGLVRGALYIFDGYIMTVPRTRHVAESIVGHHATTTRRPQPHEGRVKALDPQLRA